MDKICYHAKSLQCNLVDNLLHLNSRFFLIPFKLVYREEEREMNPLCIDQGVGLIPWSPLARDMPRLRAAASPLFSWVITRIVSPNSCSTAAVESVEPSLTTMIS